MTKATQISASLEDYIEAIFHIVAEKQAAKPRDLAEKLKVANSSVTGALKMLAGKALINYAPYDIITLTPAGKMYAQDVVRRHEVLRNFFVNVFAVNFKESDEAACSMEHSIPGAILERFIQFAKFMEVCPRGGENWITRFRQHCEKGADIDNRALHSGKNKGENKIHTVKLNSVRPGKRSDGKTLRGR
ncbi:MAG: metal-dependent transcriptional regulator [Elusimicrobiota bacterium]